MNLRKVIIVSVGLIVMLGLALVIMQTLKGMKPEPPRKDAEDVKRYVKAVKVEYGDIISYVREEGRVQPTKEVILVAEAAGKIEMGEVILKEGASFRKGQWILTIYKDEAEMLLKSRKSRFLNTVANMLPDIKIDYPDYYDSISKFVNSIELDQDLPPLPNGLVAENEKLKIFLASRNVLTDYYSIKKDEMALKRFSLYAPFNGTFLNVNFEVGAYVNPGTQLARMISTDNLEVEVPVKNDLSEWIKVGSVAKVVSEDRNQEWKGRVVRKADFIDYGTQSRSIFVKVNRSEEKVLAGEWLEVEFGGQVVRDVMEIPRSAIFNKNEVFTVVDGMLEKEIINVVKITETSAVINGLQPGVDLVTEPLINVKEKTAVEVIR
jgi:multidrug efflux pump subunit AcrA (membrane-fusion protein)